MLFVDFPDAQAPTPTSSISSYLDLLAKPAEKHYTKASYGKLDLKIKPMRQWYRMPEPSTEYVNNTYQGQKEYLAEAIALADSDVDFSRYQIVYVVPYTTQQSFAYSPTFITAPQDGIRVDGTSVNAAVTFGRDIFLAGRGHTVTVHETGHIFGLPDLYGYGIEDFNRYVGGWDMMGWIEVDPDFMVWHKWKLGWVRDGQITCIASPTTTKVRLPAEEWGTGGTKAIVIRLNAHTAYVIENRQDIIVDRYQCDDGILIYKVDANIASGQGPIRVKPAERPPANYECEGSPNMYAPLALAPYDTGNSETSTFVDSRAGLTVSVIRKNNRDDYWVDISYLPGGK